MTLARGDGQQDPPVLQPQLPLQHQVEVPEPPPHCHILGAGPLDGVHSGKEKGCWVVLFHQFFYELKCTLALPGAVDKVGVEFESCGLVFLRRDASRWACRKAKFFR